VKAATQFANWREEGSLEQSSGTWYAIHTRPRHERSVTNQLLMRRITTFLPIVTEVHRWSDRRKLVESPLFSSYVFVRLLSTYEARARVLRIEGVLRFVGSAGGASIPDEQIESVKSLLARNVPCARYPFLKVGQRVRIRGGALDGLEGIFQSQSGDDMLVVSLDVVERSLSVRLKGYDVEVI
jgi:transcription antitermination factor NusG